MKFFALSSLAGAGLILFAAFSPQTVMEKHAATLKSAKSLVVTYNVRLNGLKTDYTLTYSKPNMLVIDSAERTIESDGKTLWEYNKSAKSYTETPITPGLLMRRVQADEFLAWAAFFNEEALKGMSNFQGGTSRNIKGVTVTEVTVTLGPSTNPRQATFYIDEKLGIARGISMKTEKGDLLAMADSVVAGPDPIPAEKFAFAAPAGATKVEAPKPAAEGEGFASVQPIFQNNCSGCHGQRSPKGGYSTTSYQGVMSKSMVAAGDPDNSPLVKYITGEMQPRMPMGKAPLPAGDVEKIKAWIKAGAKE